MERYFKKSGKILLVLAPITVLSLAIAEESIRMGEDYYGNDINAAILEAQQNQRKVNYSNRYWYNRTTSQSFDLPKLSSDALEKERLEGALQPTAAGKAQSPNAIPDEEQAQTLQQNLELSKQDPNSPATPQTQPSPVGNSPQFVPEVSHTFPRGDSVTTRGMVTNGSITSTPRP